MITRKEFNELSIAEQDKIIKNLLSNIKRKIKKLETKNLLKYSRAYWLMLQNTKRYLDKYGIYKELYNFNKSSTSNVIGVRKEIIDILNKFDIEIKDIPELIKLSFIIDSAFGKTEFNYYEDERDLMVIENKKTNKKIKFEELKNYIFDIGFNLRDREFSYNENLSGYENLMKRITKSLRRFK